MARIGLALVLIGIGWFGAWEYWSVTRIWIPLQMPVSLAQGHIRTPEFKINVPGGYEFYVDFQPVFDDGSGAGGMRCPPRPRSVWSVSKGREIIARGGDERLDGHFFVPAGAYTLDLDVQDDGSCFNAASPRLVVASVQYLYSEVASASPFLRSDDQVTRAFLVALLLAVTGGNLLVRSRRARRGQEPVCSLTEPGPQRPVTTAASARENRRGRVASLTRRYTRNKPEQAFLWPFQKASWFGLVASFPFPCLIVLLGLIGFRYGLPSRGLMVHLLRPGMEDKSQLGIEPLLVRVEIEGDKVVRKLYIDSGLCPRETSTKRCGKGSRIGPQRGPSMSKEIRVSNWGRSYESLTRFAAIKLRSSCWRAGEACRKPPGHSAEPIMPRDFWWGGRLNMNPADVSE
jgi:hypothetical protein